MNAERPERKSMFPPGTIELTNAQTAEQEALQHLRSDKEHVAFGITYAVLKEGLGQQVLPQGATVNTLRGRFRADPKEPTENLFILEGEAKVKRKQITFGLALGNRDGKVVVKASRFDGMLGMGMFVKPFIPDADRIIKNEINQRIASLGEVTACSIGDGVLDCTLKKHGGSTMHASLFIR